MNTITCLAVNDDYVTYSIQFNFIHVPLNLYSYRACPY